MMDVDSLPPPTRSKDEEPAIVEDDDRPSEQALTSLKSFARIAWEDCRKPLTDEAGSAQVRWEIYSTWTLLLCLHHAEAESERCRRNFKPKPWQTEAQALQHVFMGHRSLRTLSATLRWLRWVHRWTVQHAGANASVETDTDDACGYASYERTRLKVRTAVPSPLQAAPALHPDGPLQQPTRFVDADLDEEKELLRQLWICLRRGDLRGALALCTSKGQSWRAALLQGMMPFADSTEESLGYDAMEGDGDEDLLAKVKEEHTDWTELGALDSSVDNNGNPWQKLWKEQCWDVAQRNLQQRSGSAMDVHELAIYGFCSGNYHALVQKCDSKCDASSWSDRCWGELHCLKEWLVERLLDLGREEWCGGSDGLRLGEGDGGNPDDAETPEDREIRAEKLCGRLHRASADELEAIVTREVRQIIARLREDALSAAVHLQDNALVPFIQLQASLIEAAWAPGEHNEEALGMLRGWLANGFNGAPCPFLVKQFAGYFAVWYKDACATTVADAGLVSRTPALGVPRTSEQAAELNVDDIVRSLVQDLVTAAAGSMEQCLEGQAFELIAEHVSSLSTENRLEAYTSLLLELGLRSGAGSDNATAGSRMAMAKARSHVLKRSIWVFWGRFPREAFALITVLVQRVLRRRGLRSSSDAMGDDRSSSLPMTAELAVALECVIEFWAVVRESAEASHNIVPVVAGFELLLGHPFKGVLRTVDDFIHTTMDLVALPLLSDTVLSLMAIGAEAENTLSNLKGSLLWQDAFHCNTRCVETLREVEWYLGLCERHLTWSDAHRDLEAATKGSPPFSSSSAAVLGRASASGGSGFAACKSDLEARQRCSSMAHDALFEWAATRLAQDRPLLEPLQDTHTLLADRDWRDAQGMVASRVLFILVSVFEETHDFEGAMYDLAVAVAQSPWMLQLARPVDVRAFLRRLARIPTLMPAGVSAMLATA